MTLVPPFRLPIVLLGALILAGCGDEGPKTFPVTGKVSYQGNPLPFGAVMFVPPDGPAGSAKIEPDGTYKVDLIAGAHQVSVIAVPPRQGRPDPSQEGGLDTTGFPEPKPLVPEKYNRPDTSNVQIEVQPTGENTIDIDLP
jgi:hypothetical protein